MRTTSVWPSAAANIRAVSRKLGEAKANIAIAHSLLELAYVMLKERRPYQEPDPKQMHELEKAKLVRHHARRLQQLGADDALVDELVARLNRPEDCSSVKKRENAKELPRQPIRKTSPAKVCRGALGFRARQTRKQHYSIVKTSSADAPSPAHPQSNRNKPPETNDRRTQ